MKELQISPAIDPHDFGVKLNHAIDFLCDDMKVRVKLRFRGRQKAHKEIGFEVVNKFVADVALYGHADSPPKMLGDRDLNVVLSPLPRNKRAKNPRQAEKAAEEAAASPPSGKAKAVRVEAEAGAPDEAVSGSAQPANEPPAIEAAAPSAELVPDSQASA